MKVNSENLKIDLTNIIKALNQDLSVLIPTDTIYGLISNPYSLKAIENLYIIKNRPKEKTFAIFIYPREIKHYFNFKNKIDIRNFLLFENFTPGPITFIIKNNNLNLSHLEKDGKIGIRIPNNKILLELLKIYNSPLIATSANLSGEESTNNIENINEKILNHPMVFCDLDYKNLQKENINQASSIFDISSEKIKIIRDGPIKYQDIENFLASIDLNDPSKHL